MRGFRSNAPARAAAVTGSGGGLGPAHASTSSATDYVLPELVRLLATAKRELDLHLGDTGYRCTGCGEPWPCDRAHLAAATLGVVAAPMSGGIGTVDATAIDSQQLSHKSIAPVPVLPSIPIERMDPCTISKWSRPRP
jgi:hypothetical protein